MRFQSKQIAGVYHFVGRQYSNDESKFIVLNTCGEIIKIAFALLIVALLSHGCAHTRNDGSSLSDEAVKDELIALDKALLEATVRKDRLSLERIYSDRFILIDDSAGEIIHKKQNIDEICSPEFKLKVLRGENYNVTIYNNAAYMTHDAYVESGEGEDKYVGQAKAAHYFVKTDGQWKLVFTFDSDQ
ncbi:nuclear transport factor 2 family protein [candidate division KSB1 bacterium]|nr:nuclear transport factor 2 family protein [candidate division KSB1 bacterium]